MVKLLIIISFFLVSCSLSPKSYVSKPYKNLSPKVKKIEKDFFGIQINDLTKLHQFVIKQDGKYSYNPNCMNDKIYASATIYFSNNKIDLVIIGIKNDSDNPISMNIYSDKYLIIDNLNKKYYLDNYKDILDNRYPSNYINPGTSKSFSVYGENIPNIKKENIKLILCEIGFKNVILALKPFPEKTPKKTSIKQQEIRNKK